MSNPPRPPMPPQTSPTVRPPAVPATQSLPMGARNVQPDLCTWVLIPPHGTSFKNELGGEVSLRFEVGREEEVYLTVMAQLQQWLAASHRSRMPVTVDVRPVNEKREPSLLSQRTTDIEDLSPETELKP